MDVPHRDYSGYEVRYGTDNFSIHTYQKRESSHSVVAEIIEKCGTVICTVDVKKEEK